MKLELLSICCMSDLFRAKLRILYDTDYLCKSVPTMTFGCACVYLCVFSNDFFNLTV